RFLRTPNVTITRLDPERPADFESWRNSFETVLCLNVLEYSEKPEAVIDSLAGTLTDRGSLIILVPQSPSLYGSVDRTLGHRQRFSERSLRDILDARGFLVREVYQLNKIGKP